jgi:hypothetical protein
VLATGQDARAETPGHDRRARTARRDANGASDPFEITEGNRSRKVNKTEHQGTEHRREAREPSPYRPHLPLIDQAERNLPLMPGIRAARARQTVAG